jgi:hypothetical protein
MPSSANSRIVAIGEVHTGLLLNSAALMPDRGSLALSFLPGERVRTAQRPIPYAASPDLLTGIDCALPSASGLRSRGIGTVTSRAIITGGRVLQGSAHSRLRRSDVDFRLPWSHYLSQPAVVEAIGKFTWDDLSDGFTAGRPGIDVGAVSARAMDTVQQSRYLDRKPPFRCQRTMLRWTFAHAEKTSVNFVLAGTELRTVKLKGDIESLDAIVGLCEDLALHDWLLTTLLSQLEKIGIGSGQPAQIAGRLRPAVDHLMHLWMPGAHVREDLLQLRSSLDRACGFTRQWEASVNRIRDQLALSTLSLLCSGP